MPILAGSTSTNGADVCKVVCFSCKDFGFQLLRKWIDPVLEKYPSSKSLQSSVSFLEIVHIEFGFLAMAKGVFASNLKEKVKQPEHESTILVFGSLTVPTYSL